MAKNLRVVPQVTPPAFAQQRSTPALGSDRGFLPPARQQQFMSPSQQSGWFWDGTRWLCDPCDDFSRFPSPCPPCTDEFPPLPPGCPPWFPPPAGQAPWYPGANGGVSFSQDAPSCPMRGHFWWDGRMLHLFDGAAWVDIGPGADGTGGIAVGPVPPSVPVVGQLWFDGSVLRLWNGLIWVPTSTHSYVQATAPTNPIPGDMWWDGSNEWVWDGSAWQLIATSGGIVEPPGLPAVTPVMIPWSANIVPDFSQFINAFINLTGNFILGSPINATPGQRGIIKLNQDVTGGRTWLVSPGWYFLGGTGAPSLSTGANARDILHYYVGEDHIVYGELHADFMSNSGSNAPPVVTAGNIGNMTMNGGLTAAFDGTNTKTQAASARFSFAGGGPTVIGGFVGKSYSTPQRILSATYFPPTDGKGAWGGSGGGPGSQYQLTINLRGLTGSTAPTSSTAGTVLFTQSFPITSPGLAPMTTSIAMVPNDQNTAFSFVWVEVSINYTGTIAGTFDTYCAQLTIDAHT